jgi:hypothetical protein
MKGLLKVHLSAAPTSILQQELSVWQLLVVRFSLPTEIE